MTLLGVCLLIAALADLFRARPRWHVSSCRQQPTAVVSISHAHPWAHRLRDKDTPDASTELSKTTRCLSC